VSHHRHKEIREKPQELQHRSCKIVQLLTGTGSEHHERLAHQQHNKPKNDSRFVRLKTTEDLAPPLPAGTPPGHPRLHHEPENAAGSHRARRPQAGDRAVMDVLLSVVIVLGILAVIRYKTDGYF
jgi:hypothetical protein